MLHISIPTIAIQKVNNGYVVTYKRKPTDQEKGAAYEQYVYVCVVARTDKDLLKAIKNASNLVD